MPTAVSPDGSNCRPSPGQVTSRGPPGAEGPERDPDGAGRRQRAGRGIPQSKQRNEQNDTCWPCDHDRKAYITPLLHSLPARYTSCHRPQPPPCAPPTSSSRPRHPSPTPSSPPAASPSLTTNIAGLPSLLQPNDIPGSEESNTAHLGTPLSASPYALIHVQEDFYSHAALYSTTATSFPHRTPPRAASPLAPASTPSPASVMWGCLEGRG